MAQQAYVKPHQYKVKRQKSGYVALMSTLFLGAIALSVTSSLLLFGIESTKATIVTEISKTSRSMADACAEEALQQIRSNTAFSGTNTLTISGNSCSYTVTVGSGAVRTITTSSTIGTVIRKTQLSTDQLFPKINVSSWQEIQ